MAQPLRLERIIGTTPQFLFSFFMVLVFAGPQAVATEAPPKPKPRPNIIVIFADDMGYGDIGVYGHPTINTPNLDRLAAQGQKWTQFYSAASVCTPSRAALLTGRLPIRSGMCSDERAVLMPNSSGGLPSEEVTLAEALKQQGYATACIGKWHLGHLPEYLPTQQGFDQFFGIPYSNDMDALPGTDRDKIMNPRVEYWNVPLMRDEKIIERPADQTTITKRYTQEAVRFIRENKDEPFFIYLAHNMPHVPLFASEKFSATSRRGLYGDVIEEIDSGVGQLLDVLREEGLAENTLIIFTSDNGPWEQYQTRGGSAGLLYGGKFTTWEGGMRVPGLFWWPGTIKPGVVQGLGSTLDIFTTVCLLAGADIPDDRVIDGLDLRPVLTGDGPSPRQTMIYYRGRKVHAVRVGSYKMHLLTNPPDNIYSTPVPQNPPLLYNLDHDPGERFNIADKHPEVIDAIKIELQRHLDGLIPSEDHLAGRIE
jgi:arylsulfatase A